jgi:hypothetical protein
MPLLLLTLTALLSVQASQPTIAEDVTKMSAAATNEQRFETLTSMLEARNLPFTVEPFTIPKPVGREPRTDGRNVVITLGEGDTLVIVGAHYDAARLPDGSLSKGAVDNAASSMLLIRAAEAMRTEKLRVRVRFVWFDMEELGLVGSAQYLQHNKKQVEIGTLAPIEIVRAESEVATRNQDLIIARTNLQLQQTLMKNAVSRSLNDATLAALPVVPTDVM